ncbi:MAG: hypothetical protein DRP45_03750 [Candidatus Zixiibacteriota bacterium]|nr:MAG: hypothetical protein DRP45_03750 [candidate division Zixibacteria bacterium]
MRNLTAALLSAVICFLSVSSVLAGGDWNELKNRPRDSAKAENVRVWLAQESNNPCQMTVDIFDSDSNLVRHLVDDQIDYGYYNLYWDCKDDSGKYVTRGQYFYETNDCGGNRSGELFMAYSKGETTSSLDIDNWSETGEINFVLQSDSSVVSLDICNTQGTTLKALLKDSVMLAGDYAIDWRPTRLHTKTYIVFVVRLTVDDFIHEKQVLPKGK